MPSINIDSLGNATYSGTFLHSGEKIYPYCTTTTYPTGYSGCWAINNLKEGECMETLYNVIIVDKSKEILLDKKVVASDTEKAKFKAGVYKILDEKGIDLDNVTVICNSLGSVKVYEVQ